MTILISNHALKAVVVSGHSHLPASDVMESTEQAGKQRRQFARGREEEALRMLSFAKAQHGDWLATELSELAHRRNLRRCRNTVHA